MSDVDQAFQGWYYAAIILPSLMWVITVAYVVSFYLKYRSGQLNKEHLFTKLTLFSLVYGSLTTLTAWISLPILAAGDWDYCKFFVIFTYGITDAFNPLSINLNVLLGLYRLTLVKNEHISDRKKTIFKTYCILIIVVTFVAVCFDLYGAFPQSLEKIAYGCDWSLAYHIAHNSLVLVLDVLNTIGSIVIIYESWKTLTVLKHMKKSRGTEKLKSILNYMIINACFSLFIYKPIIIVEYCRAWVHFGEWAFLGFFLFIQSFFYSLDNVVTGYCTLAIMNNENKSDTTSKSRTERSCTSTKKTTQSQLVTSRSTQKGGSDNNKVMADVLATIVDNDSVFHSVSNDGVLYDHVYDGIDTSDTNDNLIDRKSVV